MLNRTDVIQHFIRNISTTTIKTNCVIVCVYAFVRVRSWCNYFNFALFTKCSCCRRCLERANMNLIA